MPQHEDFPPQEYERRGLEPPPELSIIASSQTGNGHQEHHEETFPGNLKIICVIAINFKL